MASPLFLSDNKSGKRNLKGTNGPKIPLPPDYFSYISLTKEQKISYKDEATHSLRQGLELERTFLQKGRSNGKEWKLLHRKRELEFYVNVSKSRRANAPPIVVCSGTMQGNMYDLLYGDYTPTGKEFMQRVAYVQTAAVTDARLIANVCVPVGTPYDNPNFLYVGIKWCATRVPIPGADFFMKMRDWLYYEALGLTNDSSSSPIGYIVMRPCELSNLGTFKNSTRARLGIISLYRQLTPKTVQIFTQSCIDLGGDATMESMHLRLTLQMARRTCEIAQYLESKKLAEALESAEPNQFIYKNSDQCLNCHRVTWSSMIGLVMSLRQCSICGQSVCSKCRTKKRMAGKNLVKKLWCCQRCVMASQRDFEPAVSMEPSGEEATSSNEADDVFESNEMEQLELCDTEANGLYSVGESLIPQSAEEVSSENASHERNSLLSWRNVMESTVHHSEDAETATNGSEVSNDSIRPRDMIDLEINTSTLRSTAVVEEYDEMDHSNSRPLNVYQTTLYHQMVALRQAAETAYELTQANRKAMNK